eukprot:206176_1
MCSPENGRAASTVILRAVIAALMIPIVIWSIYKHFKTPKAAKTVVFKITIIFYFCILFFMLNWPVWCYGVCIRADSVITASGHLFEALYSAQWTLLLLILFTRVFLVFRGTVHKLSKCSIYFFLSIYIPILILYIFGFVFIIIGQWSLFILCFLFAVLLMLILAIYLPITFVMKLSKIVKNTMEKSNETSNTMATSCSSASRSESASNQNAFYINVIIKCTVLTTMSLISTMIMVFFAVLYFGVEIPLGADLNGLGMQFDAITNFFCIMLSNKFAEKQYLMLCEWIHGFCKAKVTDINNNTANQLSAMMETTNTSQPSV